MEFEREVVLSDALHRDRCVNYNCLREYISRNHSLSSLAE